jgi:hypothetical protein
VQIDEFPKVRMLEFKIKALLICFFENRHIIHFKFVLEGSIVNRTFYLELLSLGAAEENCGNISHRLLSTSGPVHPLLRVSQILAGESILGPAHPAVVF